MKALVVYESMFGNTAAVAQAIAGGLGVTMDVEVREVHDGSLEGRDDVELLVVGGPTHALSMSRPKTREEAESQGGIAGRVDFGLRDWLNSASGTAHGLSMVTFDTRMVKARRLPGSAAKSAARLARKRGFSIAAPPESFYVVDTAGPLAEGEIERATDWGRVLGALLPSA